APWWLRRPTRSSNGRQPGQSRNPLKWPGRCWNTAGPGAKGDKMASAQKQRSTEPDALPISKAGVIVAEGYGLRLYVRNGTLIVEDGEGENGRQARLVRASSKGRRVVLLGSAGSVTVEALRWMA